MLHDLFNLSNGESYNSAALHILVVSALLGDGAWVQKTCALLLKLTKVSPDLCNVHSHQSFDLARFRGVAFHVVHTRHLEYGSNQQEYIKQAACAHRDIRTGFKKTSSAQMMLENKTVNLIAQSQSLNFSTDQKRKQNFALARRLPRDSTRLFLVRFATLLCTAQPLFGFFAKHFGTRLPIPHARILVHQQLSASCMIDKPQSSSNNRCFHRRKTR